MVSTSTRTERPRSRKLAYPAEVRPHAHPETPRSLSAAGDRQQAAQRMRPSTTPTYYLGRPASFWLTVNRRSKQRGKAA